MCVMTFLVAMAFSIIVPVLPLYVRDFGASNFQIGAVIAGFALTLRSIFRQFLGFLLRSSTQKLQSSTMFDTIVNTAQIQQPD
jgi:MFS family permease